MEKGGQLRIWLVICFIPFLSQRVKANSPILYENGDIREYCQLDKFTADCSDQEVIIVTSAEYGRMRLGKCVKRAYGSLGCSNDVLLQMDRLCSGRSHCDFDVARLHAHHPCPSDLTPFLEASYYCQPVSPGPPQGCNPSTRATTILKHPTGYISNHMSMESGWGTGDCPWRIQVPPGQKINITLINFARITISELEEGGTGPGKPNICYQYARFDEADNSRILTECQGGHRMRHAYISNSNTMNVTVLTKKDMGVYFMLYYEAVGCPNPVLSSALWVQRSDSTATVRCNSSGDSWTLKCVGTEWHGDVGNCTIIGGTKDLLGKMFEGEGFPYSILIVVAIGVALGVFLGGVLLVCASKYFKRRRDDQLRSGNFQQSLYGLEHGKILASQFDDVGSSPRTLHYQGTRQDDQTLATCDKECKCTFSSYGPPPGYHPASQISSHMYESPQFDRKDSR